MTSEEDNFRETSGIKESVQDRLTIYMEKLSLEFERLKRENEFLRGSNISRNILSPSISCSVDTTKADVRNVACFNAGA